MNFQSISVGLNGKGSCIKTGEAVEIRSGGADIWGKHDEFMFYSTEATGDFTFVARLESFQLSDLYAKAGLMARETLDPGSRHVIFAAFPGNGKRNKNNGGYEFQYRIAAGLNSSAIYPSDYVTNPPAHSAVFPDVWLKLERKGNTFLCYSGATGSDWKFYSSYESALPGKVYIGLAVTAHSKKKMTLTKFSNIIVK